jgi:hypothetical protein
MQLSDSNVASLTYLANPLYKQVLKQQTQLKNKISKSDIKFYRKRISSITKEMLKGDIPDNSYIQSIYESYVNGLIKYFKMIDTRDIIQEQYDSGTGEVEAGEVGANEVGANAGEVGANEVGANANEVDIDITNNNLKIAEDILCGDYESLNLKEVNVNDDLMRRYAGVATLDKFVIKQHNETKETRIIPVILDVNLKEPSLKKKGVKEKQPKKELGTGPKKNKVNKVNNKLNTIVEVPEDQV